MDTAKRMNRLIGQLKGIQRMIETKRDCSEVLQQISAVKKAIDGLSREILVSDICQYVPSKDAKKVGEMVGRAINL
ncbi:hypothetical protein A2774_06005 [Candidatus Roizmanbacteria bacterium RIFCSPHIGHO2_01_FULL_39_12c]|uniref:Cytoplasmic protein n=1 Tax=Candidatus Roizmanbacteria bacterium RIFCSPHIGHO2_01_FULL_39_12c TaxID=1802031 RepID=A0A1F7G9L5_9BACT|nr:MAG: hypothetical protein A2774_06005 [Candidatus Roizmanbacteria bacterium RIFCSPHIGHO2_01_FULL_39_12c]OGK47240.1 MAG: hypothetical protein A2963_04205 [Candidatus Roizmanbacteria bacterium RIFCSPLOWO2_01_FULL_40_13]